MPKRTDFAPYVAVVGQDKPAISVDDQQLCVEGLEHGDTYSITLRTGLPSTVDEALLKDAEFTIYVRDRSPSVRLAGKAYVLPKTGQQGIPLVTVNTDRLKVTIYRIGDRSLLDNVLGYEFERNLQSYSLDEIADQKGEKVWTGELKVEKELNQPTSPPPSRLPKRYRQCSRASICSRPQPANAAGDDYGERATQWFIVSDLGLTSFSGTDGIHAFVNSLATTSAIGDVEIRLIARNNDVLAVKKTDADGSVDFRAGACPRRRRSVACYARRIRRRRRLRFPQSEAIGFRPDRPRRRGARVRRARSMRSCSPSAASIAPARRSM